MPTLDNTLNWSPTPWGAFASQKQWGYTIGKVTASDPAWVPPDPPDPNAHAPLVTTYPLDRFDQNAQITHLGDFKDLASAQAAAQADANS
jgi:hypothetical protein